MRHIVANITWQSDYWNGTFSEEDRSHTGHSWVKESSDNIPHEWQLFNLDEHIADGFKVGYFQTSGVPKTFDNGRGIVFFCSSDWREGGRYIVGFYAKAEVAGPVFDVEDQDGSRFKGNVRAPHHLCVRWKDARRLPLKTGRHLKGRGPGQAGFVYVDDEHARNIIQDAIEAHNDTPDLQSKLAEIMNDVLSEADSGEGDPQYYLEYTTNADENRPWPVGEALFTPQVSSSGRHPPYELMKSLRQDDIVLHVRSISTSRKVEGVSRVAASYEEAEREPGVPGYVVKLHDFQGLKAHFDLSDLLQSDEVGPYLQRALEEKVSPLLFGKPLKVLNGRYLSNLSSGFLSQTKKYLLGWECLKTH